MGLRDKDAEIALYWRVVRESRIGEMSAEEAIDELEVMERYTDSTLMREQCRREIDRFRGSRPMAFLWS